MQAEDGERPEWSNPDAAPADLWLGRALARQLLARARELAQCIDNRVQVLLTKYPAREKCSPQDTTGPTTRSK
jgi:hypothetical protein